MEISSPKVALMQPTFLPWQGYFALIEQADIFVFLDDFQFSRRSFDQRNRLFVAKEQIAWITLPVEHRGSQELTFHQLQPMLEPFRGKFLAQLQAAYGKTSYFKVIYPWVEEWISGEWSDLAALSSAFIERAAALLGYAPRFLRSSELGSEGRRSSRLASLLQRVGAKSYLSARGSYEYMLEDALFPLAGVETYFQDFDPVPYPQLQAEQFCSHLSVLDALFQVGPEQTKALIAEGQQAFIPWAEMASAS